MIPGWTEVYAGIFLMALALAVIFTPLCQILAQKTAFLDIPANEQHKQHKKATPLLGGVAMFLAWVLTVGGGIAAGRYFLPPPIAESLRQNVMSFAMLPLCALLCVALGTYDDKYAISAGKKLIGQILIAVLAVWLGGIRLSLFINHSLISGAITVFWFIFIFNAINFFDNMDGLACGTATIAFFFFTVAAMVNGQYFVACLGASCVGASAGFWFYNHSPASIFMGDGGSHFLAFLLAVISAKVTYYNGSCSASELIILTPLFILAVPIFDAFAVVLIRLKNKKKIYVGDHNHISHRFHHMGMDRKQAVLLVHLLCLISGLGALPLLWGDLRTCFVLLIQGVVIFLLLSLLQSFGRRDTEEKK
ncbi:MAG: undecaprenyl/decaprenyl-phosphate alpha-N-acetylglucosaminyl 1-phosphate transferase [Lentisphaeria bacterium]|nr:undecaprenyl/decaprenyl-phosphate alpha-N-acetylglucosaminyl 1-phosphate transferase [Lentisphaeria bacterium]